MPAPTGRCAIEYDANDSANGERIPTSAANDGCLRNRGDRPTILLELISFGSGTGERWKGWVYGTNGSVGRDMGWSGVGDLDLGRAGVVGVVGDRRRRPQIGVVDGLDWSMEMDSRRCMRGRGFCAARGLLLDSRREGIEDLRLEEGGDSDVYRLTGQWIGKWHSQEIRKKRLNIRHTLDG